MSKITLANGIVLDDEACSAPTLRERIKYHGLQDSLRVFHATHPSGREEYLLVKGTDPVFASQSAEGLWSHIDIEALIASGDTQ